MGYYPEDAEEDTVMWNWNNLATYPKPQKWPEVAEPGLDPTQSDS